MRFLLKDMSFNSSHMNQNKLQFNQFEIKYTQIFFIFIFFENLLIFVSIGRKLKTKIELKQAV